MNRRTLVAALVCVPCLCVEAQNRSSEKAEPPSTLSEQNPSVVPNMYELGRRAGVSEEDHTKLNKIEQEVDNIRGTLSWMKGAWWALGAALAFVVLVVKFFGPSVFVAIDHRMETARTNAATKKRKG